MQITENDLDAWAIRASVEARGVLAGLIKRLVAESCPGATRRFPDEDSIGQQGSDGSLETIDGSEPFVPSGKSFWEFGAGKDPASKATTDYEKATTDTPLHIRKESTFIFVTPRSGVSTWPSTWKGKVRWLEERKQRGEWKDVRVIDATILADWINEVPAIKEWFMTRIKHPAAGSESIETHWESIRTIGEPPPLQPMLFLANRNDAIGKIESVFNRTTNKLQLGTRYPNQLIDFISAYIASLEKERRAEVAGRTIIIKNPESYNRAINLNRSHIFVIPFELDNEDRAIFLNRALQKNHQVIYPGPIGGSLFEQVSVLNPSAHQIEEALISCGYKTELARKLSIRTGGNLRTLLNIISEASELPTWSQTDDASALAVAEMIGAWRTDVEKDMQAIENLAGKSFGEWLERMIHIKSLPNAPLRQTDNVWKFIERFEGWYSLGRRILPNQLTSFKEIALSTFKETDSKIADGSIVVVLSKPEGEIKNSSYFREGISETLALMGSHPQAVSSIASEVVKNCARTIVNEVLHNNTWENWATLNHLLPNFAEAAPSEFMNAVENAIDRGLFDSLFSSENGGLFGRTHVSGILWSLEALAWDSSYFMRAINILAALASIDPGGKFTNRPQNTLIHIFLPWLPQTTASIDQRENALKIMLEKHPTIGRKLLLSLLPDVIKSSSHTYRPKWRDSIPNDWPRSPTIQEFKEQTVRYINLLIQHVSENPNHIIEVVKNFNVLPPDDLKKSLMAIEKAQTKMSAATKLELWEELSNLIRRHKRFSDAEWAIDDDSLAQISRLTDKLKPNLPSDIYRTLFGDRVWDYFDTDVSYEDQIKRMNTLKESAAFEIFSTEGISRIFEFYQNIKSPETLGYALGKAVDEPIDHTVFAATINSTAPQSPAFLSGFVAGRFEKFGWKWFNSLDLSVYTDGQKAELLIFLPFNKDSWTRAADILKNSEHLYWEKVPAFGYHIEDDVDFIVEKLLQSSRPLDAIRVLHQSNFKTKKLNTKLTSRALLAFIKDPASLKNSMDIHTLQELIKKLQDDSNISEDDLSAIEWNLLPLLDRNSHPGNSPKMLNKRMAQDPVFFCQVVDTVYQPASKIRPRSEISETEQIQAKNAYSLLESWNIVPGTTTDGFDENAFTNWYLKVKELSAHTDRFEIAQSILGKVLRFSVADPSGLWIHKTIAAALDEKSAEHLRDGYRVGVFNSRGVFWVDPEGKEELTLAKTYRDRSHALEILGFTRIANTLAELASGYEAEAHARIRAERTRDE